MLTDYFYLHLRRSVKIVLPLDSMTEVISLTLGEICQVPGVHPALLGVVNQRGKLLWVLDLSDLLQLPLPATPWRSQDSLTLIVLSRPTNSTTGNQHQIGCVVSALKGIEPLDPTAFQTASESIFTDAQPFISQTAEIEQSLAGVLDVKAVLATIHSTSTTSVVNRL